jgi:gluconokinase
VVWNEFIRKFGWNDKATPVLQQLKAQSGLAGRDDIVTMVEYMEVDEGRKP